jgi:crotonobetainyl-CoA:carnitine CoA-transferase CaiB-like acyl-CoA transferase
VSAKALSHLRICDFTGQLAGAGSTKWLAAFGAEVIRIEDPVKRGTWDILRTMPPFIDERRGVDFGGGFNNHNVEKLGITLNLRTERGRELLYEIVKRSDVVAENFAAGVLARMGLSYEKMKELRPDIIYVSNCGFGHVGPYASFKTWGPIVQAVSGLTFSSGLPDREPAGWGYSFMDHTGAYVMAEAILFALVHRQRTGEGQWVDMSCTDAGLTLHGPALLDWTVNGRPMRRPGSPHANRSEHPAMAPHGIYPALGDDEWVAIACRTDAEWRALAGVVGEPWAREGRASPRSRAARSAGRARHEARRVDARAYEGRCGVGAARRERARRAGREARGAHRCRSATAGFGLWPTVTHAKMGRVRVDGLPVHFAETDWEITHGGPCLGEHTERVLTGLLGLLPEEVTRLREEGVV